MEIFSYRVAPIQINYLGFAGTILIGDSSQGDEYLASQEAVNRFNTKLNVRHIFLPPEEFPTCGAAVKHLISISETDYLAQFGDDDVKSSQSGRSFSVNTMSP